MKNIYKYKIYNLDSIIDIQEEIKEELEEKMEKIKQKTFSERLNKTNAGELGGKECEFWYKTEIVLSKLDKDLEYKNQEGGEKYDFIKYKEDWSCIYIDVKGIKIWLWKCIDDIISKKYCVYLLKEQVDLSKKFCDNNWIDYKNFRFDIIWWNDKDENNLKFIRAISNKLYLSEILKQEPIFENPPYTNGSNTNWNYKIFMVWKEGENIITN